MLPEFSNEPLTDFSIEANRNAFRAALGKIEARLPIQGENRIGGRRVGAARTFESVNPCDARQVIGRFPEGTKEDAVAAIEAAEKAFHDLEPSPGGATVSTAACASRPSCESASTSSPR